MAKSTFTAAQKAELTALIAEAVKASLSQTLSQSPSSAKKVTAPKPQNAKGKNVAVPKLTIKDFEPKKGSDGQYNWASYKAQRGKYCYFVATDGAIKDGKTFGTDWYGKVDFDSKGKYYTAKAEYEKKFKYVKVADR